VLKHLFAIRKFYLATSNKQNDIVNKTRYICVCVVRVVVFNATFNNISVISWLSVLLVKETGVPRENQQPPASR